MATKPRQILDTQHKVSVDSELGLPEAIAREAAQEASGPQVHSADLVPKLMSALSDAVAATAVPTSAARHSGAPAVVVSRASSGLAVGDVVRSTESYWLKTHQHLTGAIARFEPVPGREIETVQSDYWVYLNSGEGPISLAIIEKAPA